jgi:hypothetical protein
MQRTCPSFLVTRSTNKVSRGKRNVCPTHFSKFTLASIYIGKCLLHLESKRAYVGSALAFARDVNSMALSKLLSSFFISTGIYLLFIPPSSPRKRLHSFLDRKTTRHPTGGNRQACAQQPPSRTSSTPLLERLTLVTYVSNVLYSTLQ